MRKLGCKLLLCAILIALAILTALKKHILAHYENEITHLPSTGWNVANLLAIGHFIGFTPPHAEDFYLYNTAVSNVVDVARSLPDSRNTVCGQRTYNLPRWRANISVVIAFHNEARTTLLRTIMSIYNRSPPKYLYELVLIDDCSEDAGLLAALWELNFAPFIYEYTASEKEVNSRRVTIRTQRNSRRLGLIASRNKGAKLASGDLLLFLDSHCEVNVGWLEPLLERIASARGFGNGDSTLAVSPVLDSIDAATLQYHATSNNLMGGFDWSLHFHWLPRSEHPQATPDGEVFKSPTFAGGIFMISRNWFFKLNAFNSLLEIWGGESIEFSIKLWLCGGQIEIVPCSRIGHIFRRQHPFQFPSDTDAHGTYLRNSKIIAESWLDAYKHFFYASKPAARDIPVNISQWAVNQLRQNLRCRSFDWYLKHVFPQLRPPKEGLSALGTLSSGDVCLQIADDFDSSVSTTNQLVMSSCYDVGVSQWYLDKKLQQLHTTDNACLSVLLTQNLRLMSYDVVVQPCSKSLKSQQRWLRRGPQLMHAAPLTDVSIIHWTTS